MSAPSLAGRPLITKRGIQIALGCVWLLVGLLQFQSFMYTSAFLTQIVEPTAAGSPSFVSGPILTFAHFYGHDQVLWNSLAGEIQCAIGLGLIISKRSVRPALFVSFFWAFWVWWMGEGFAMVFSPSPVSPLMGAPGAVILYGLIGLLVWPTSRPADRSAADGGPIGDRGGKIVWSVIWLESAYLWLLNVNRSKNAINGQLLGMAGGAPHIIATWETSVANASKNDGETIAVLLAIVSVLIGVGVWTRLRGLFLATGIVLSLAYWVLGQALGGPFWIGNATDVNSGPLFVLLALTLMPPLTFATIAQRARSARAKPANASPAT
jgi:hypothetical protein